MRKNDLIMKRDFVEPHSWTPGYEETAPIHEDLRRSARLRKLIDRQKRVEEATAPFLKWLLMWMGLGHYTSRVRIMRRALHQSEWKVVDKAREVFITHRKDFNNFCLGITFFDYELGRKIEDYRKNWEDPWTEGLWGQG